MRNLLASLQNAQERITASFHCATGGKKRDFQTSGQFGKVEAKMENNWTGQPPCLLETNVAGPDVVSWRMMLAQLKEIHLPQLKTCSGRLFQEASRHLFAVLEKQEPAQDQLNRGPRGTSDLSSTPKTGTSRKR